MQEDFRLDYVAKPDSLAFMIRYLDPHRALARHPLDQDALRPHREAQIFGKPGHPVSTSRPPPAGIQTSSPPGRD